MFRRLPSGLPKDPVFGDNLNSLGYFVNDNDEIRSIENPKAYFKFFLTKNDRHNCIQREAMNDAIRKLIGSRLQQLGLEELLLPLGAHPTEPHLPIRISSNIGEKKRVIILFGESSQDLGIFAHRIIGGKGGINQGSAINLVKYIQSQNTSPDNDDSPGIILANMGQLRWWRKGKKAVTLTSWNALPASSAVEQAYAFDEEKNTIPKNRNTYEHVEYIFNEVVEKLCAPDAQLQVIAVSEGAVQVQTFLEMPENFKKWGKRVDALAVLATYFLGHEIKNPEFAEWFVDHGRGYLISDEPAGAFLADYDGRKLIPAYGCPVFSLGEPYYSETMLPKGYKIVVDWLQEVASDPKYANPKFERINIGGDEDGEDDEVDERPWNAHEKLGGLNVEERIVEAEDDKENFY